MLNKTDKNFISMKKRLADERYDVDKKLTKLNDDMEKALLEKVD
jgi:hypothetical protein